MTIFCKLCHHEIHSEKPDLEAQSAILEQMSVHLGIVHRKEAVRLSKLLTGIATLAATYTLIRHYVEIPPEEMSLLQSLEKNEQGLMAALGIELTEVQTDSD